MNSTKHELNWTPLEDYFRSYFQIPAMVQERQIVLEHWSHSVWHWTITLTLKQTRNTVIQWLTLNYDLDLEPTLVKYTHCTSTYHTRHLCRVMCKSHYGFKRYKADTIVCLTSSYHIDLETWTNIRSAHRIIILDICAELFVNLTRSSKDIERIR